MVLKTFASMLVRKCRMEEREDDLEEGTLPFTLLRWLQTPQRNSELRGKDQREQKQATQTSQDCRATEIWAAALAQLGRDSDSLEISKVLLQLLSPTDSSNSLSAGILVPLKPVSLHLSLSTLIAKATTHSHPPLLHAVSTVQTRD